jgi:hypothetical protein
MLSVSSDSFSSYTDSSRPRRCDGMPYCVTAAPKTLITAQKTITVPTVHTHNEISHGNKQVSLCTVVQIQALTTHPN